MQPEPETGLAVLGCGGIGLVAQAAEAAVQDGRQKRVQFVLHAGKDFPCRAVGKRVGALGSGLQFPLNG